MEISHWLLLFADKLPGNTEDLKQAEDRATHHATSDNVRVELILLEHMTGLGKFYAIICNFVGDSNAMWLSADNIKYPLVTKARNYFFRMLKLTLQNGTLSIV